MSVFVPNLILDRVTQINIEKLKQLDVKGILLDIDNTLAIHDNPNPYKGISEWIENMKLNRVPMFLISNNYHPRVEKFANIVGLGYIAQGYKPLRRNILKACKEINLPPEKVCIVGDQIFTDVWGGNLSKLKTILVMPFETKKEENLLFKLKRKIENVYIRKYYKNNKKGSD